MSVALEKLTSLVAISIVLEHDTSKLKSLLLLENNIYPSEVILVSLEI